MRHYKELLNLLNDEQKKESQKLFDKFYANDFSHLDSVKSLSDTANDLCHDRKINLLDWD